MVNETQEDRQMPGIEHVGKHKRGYDAKQVDAFLEDAHAKYDSQDLSLTLDSIQNAAFRLVNGGYVIGQVDSALARLGRAVADRQTLHELNTQGGSAWMVRTKALYNSLQSHAQRASKERFARGKKGKPSYSVRQVDQLVDMVVRKAQLELGADAPSEKETKKLADVNSVRVTNTIFTQAKGKRGYDERQVDYYLACCSELLNRIESYERLGGAHRGSLQAVSSVAKADVPQSPDVVQQASAKPFFDDAGDASVQVQPLFADDASLPHAQRDANESVEPIAFAPEAADGEKTQFLGPLASGDDSFADMQRREQELFRSSASSDTVANPVPVPPASMTEPLQPHAGVVPVPSSRANDSEQESERTPNAGGNSSLAALAHSSVAMNQQEQSADTPDDSGSTNTEVIAPPVPTLSVPTPPREVSSDSASDASVPDAASVSVDSNDWLFMPHDNDFEIPNLIFPDISTDATATHGAGDDDTSTGNTNTDDAGNSAGTDNKV